ncbi:MAG: HipA domain-containing protein [Alphaproteobacteria bacterium]|nr:HipA domain-containing protein [Alphaproteobacteria bacterium]
MRFVSPVVSWIKSSSSPPKASVIDRDGSLAIAKFPQADDLWQVPLWEVVALDLAERAGITVAGRRIEKVDGKPVLIVSRFDRQSATRIPFLSAMSMLTAADNEDHSYLEIADVLRTYRQALGAGWA